MEIIINDGSIRNLIAFTFLHQQYLTV